MSQLLPQALEVLRPRLPAALVPPAAFTAIRDLAGALAPMVRLGLECPLGGGGTVDVSQHLRTADDGPRLLRSLAERSGGHPAWQKIAGFAAAWAAGERLGGREVDGVWLEYDLDPTGRGAPVPSIFVGLAGAEAASVETIGAVLASLGADGLELERSVARVVAAAERRGGSALPMAAVMLARGGEARVGFRDLAPGALAAFLEDIRWPGAPAGVQAWAGRLGPLCSLVPVWLELAPAPRPRLGLEFVYASAAHRVLLPRLLDHLVAAGCCSADERDALLGWPGIDNPGTSAAPWPESLLLATLRRPPHEFSVLRRSVHHVKVSVGSGPPRAKAYLGFVHSWETRAPGALAHAT